MSVGSRVFFLDLGVVGVFWVLGFGASAPGFVVLLLSGHWGLQGAAGFDDVKGLGCSSPWFDEGNGGNGSL